MQISVNDLGGKLNGQVDGDGAQLISGIAPISRARATDVTFAETDKHFPAAAQCAAAAVIVPAKASVAGKTLIRVANPRAAFARALQLIFPARRYPAQIHPTAQLGRDVKLGKDVFIGEYAVLRDGVAVGNRTVIEAQCFVGEQTTLGNDCLLHPGVKLYHRLRIGDRVIIHAGSVIGSDGFGYAQEAGQHIKIPQLGDVIVEDDVEIGANVTIDRATMDSTIIKRGTKIDNLVQIAHNVTIGESSIVIAQAGIAGSAQLGKNVTLAGQAGIGDHLKIGDNVIIAAQAGVMNDLEPNSVVVGAPAQPAKQFFRQVAALRKLPDLLRKLAVGKE